MNEPTYYIKYSPIDKIYTFESVGRYGTIEKVVNFVEFQKNVFNLGFGDLDPLTDEVDDKIISDNGDMKTIIATVFAIIQDFFIKNPTANVYFKGSTKSRTRLYQIAINLNFEDFSHNFEIFGSENDTFVEAFQKGKNYESFLIRKLL